jgi:hypothetical protein
VVLVAVADDKAVFAFMHRQGDHQFGLGAGLEAVAKFLSGGDDLIDDLAQLVDLDGEYAAVGTLVVLLLDGLVEELVELGNAVAQEILEADDERGFQAHADGLVDDVHDANLAAVGERLDVYETIGAGAKMAGAPAFETVEFFGLRN